MEIFRLEAARRLLEDSTRNAGQIARQWRFGDEERMRVTLQRDLGVAPRELPAALFRQVMALQRSLFCAARARQLAASISGE